MSNPPYAQRENASRMNSLRTSSKHSLSSSEQKAGGGAARRITVWGGRHSQLASPYVMPVNVSHGRRQLSQGRIQGPREKGSEMHRARIEGFMFFSKKLEGIPWFQGEGSGRHARS